MEHPMTTNQFVLTVSCKSTRGIVAAISGFLADKGCNIVDSSQFDDLETGKFFMRISFISEVDAKEADLVEQFGNVAKKFEMDYQFHRGDDR